LEFRIAQAKEVRKERESIKAAMGVRKRSVIVELTIEEGRRESVCVCDSHSDLELNSSPTPWLRR